MRVDFWVRSEDQALWLLAKTYAKARDVPFVRFVTQALREKIQREKEKDR